MQKIFSKNRGESIMESLIAISIIITSLAGIMALFSDNIKTNQSTKKRIIAINLAREGIEAVRFVRDSNWLVYSNNRRSCWNNDTTLEICQYTNGFTNNPLYGNYNAVMDPTNFTWKLTQDDDGVNGILDLDNQLFLKNGFYLHDNTGKITPFLRQIKISYPDHPGNPPTSNAVDNRIQVKSIVQWSNGQRIELETILTDFLERNWHNET